jgi:hypothetical protein
VYRYVFTATRNVVGGKFVLFLKIVSTELRARVRVPFPEIPIENICDAEFHTKMMAVLA